MPLDSGHEDDKVFLENLIDDSVMGCDVAGIHVAAFSFQLFGVPSSSSWMIHQLLEDFLQLFEKYRIRFLPLSDDLVCIRRNFNSVHGYIESK